MRAARITLAAALALASVEAQAHGSVKGLGTFFSGVVHPLMEPSHLVGLIALALLLGPRWASERPSEYAFVGAIAAGSSWAAFGPRFDSDIFLTAAAALIGAMVVLARKLPGFVYVVAACAIGLGIGTGSWPDPEPGVSPWAVLGSSALGAVVWLINGALLVQGLRRPWMRILVRVAGSWVTASSILVLALVLSCKLVLPGAAPKASSDVDVRRLR